MRRWEVTEFDIVLVFESAGGIFAVERDGCVLRLDEASLVNGDGPRWMVLGVGKRIIEVTP